MQDEDKCNGEDDLFSKCEIDIFIPFGVRGIIYQFGIDLINK